MLGNVLRCLSVQSTTLSLHKQGHCEHIFSSLHSGRYYSRWIGSRAVWALPYSSPSRTVLQSSSLKRGVVNLRSDMGGVDGSSSSGAGGGPAAASHKHTNRLAKEHSPYLLQHAHNPVDWYPWGKEAFAKARAEDRPIFLSAPVTGAFSFILCMSQHGPDKNCKATTATNRANSTDLTLGRSSVLEVRGISALLTDMIQSRKGTIASADPESEDVYLSINCAHGVGMDRCHVMEVESFESERVANLMNDWFVNIKVDREERPDVDKVYMAYVQATQGGGGWPMSVFLTPELKPIVGGTYFPPDDKYGRPGFKTVLRRVHEVWMEKKDSLREAGDQIVQQLAEASTATSSSQDLPEGTAQQAIQFCTSQLAKGFDLKLGGFGGPPKFPRPVEIVAMLQRYKRLEQNGKETAASKNLEMALFTLRCMARGGMHDHIGGGFHRYSVDEYWHVPHFEKMLYDQGQLVNVYLDAFAISKDPQYALVARDVLDYLARAMTHPDGGIFSAEDADSAESESSSKKKEGSFYVWTSKEIETCLGKESAAIFATHYYVKPGGNCDLSRGSDPHNEFTGKNVLIDRQGLAETATKVGTSVEELDKELGRCREVLYGYREKRPRPHLDDKVIVAWNGLAISALSRASRILKMEPQGLEQYFPVTGLDCKEYLAAAERAAHFIRTKLYNEATKRLYRSYRKGPSEAPGFVDDYAFLIAGLLDLYEAGGDSQWLAWALDVQSAQDEQFLDKVGGGYYSTPEGDSSILFRMKEDYDGAEPSGNSVAAINLIRLASIVTGDKSESYSRTAEHLLSVFEPRVREAAMAVPLMCVAFDLFVGPPKRQIVIAGVKQAPDTEALLNAAFSTYDPDKVILQIDDTNAKDREFWQTHNPNALATARKSREGKASAYVCQNFSCLARIEEPDGLAQTLRQAPSTPKLTTFKLGATPK